MADVIEETPHGVMEEAIRAQFGEDTRAATVKDLANVYVTLTITHDLILEVLVSLLKADPSLSGTAELKAVQALLEEQIRSIARNVTALADDEQREDSSDGAKT